MLTPRRHYTLSSFLHILHMEKKAYMKVTEGKRALESFDPGFHGGVFVFTDAVSKRQNTNMQSVHFLVFSLAVLKSVNERTI
jgi:hypothetical protein